MKKLLALVLFAVGCGEGEPIAQLKQPSTQTEPISGLEAYLGGKVLYPYFVDKPDSGRWPLTPFGAWNDPQCYFSSSLKCVLYECESGTHKCPTGSRCVSAALNFQPSPFWEPPPGIYFNTVYLATCIR